MKVAELKQVVDANAVEMRAGFARVDARLTVIEGDIGEMKGEIGEMKGEMGQMKGEMGLMRDEMAKMNKKIDERAAETDRHLAFFAEQIVNNFTVVMDDLEGRVDRRTDQKIAASEARLTRKFSRR